ncbi:hypothetical protein DUI87_11544 [Hirundo rustica rustica]|uniref:Uncharacterized protein n=1 Tax=Hirundo rustica rustica TaxID=333673 RepID=A0A3M0KEH2_HIRRU|nr:hypothetical protein DUI87_11544 [Hirundo rustica rustica]
MASDHLQYWRSSVFTVFKTAKACRHNYGTKIWIHNPDMAYCFGIGYLCLERPEHSSATHGALPGKKRQRCEQGTGAHTSGGLGVPGVEPSYPGSTGVPGSPGCLPDVGHSWRCAYLAI